MRILQVSAGYPPESIGGAELYVKFLSEELAKKHEVYVFTADLPMAKEEERNGVILYGSGKVSSPLRATMISMSYRNKKIESTFRSYIAKIDPDIVHFHNIWSFRSGLLPKIAKDLGYKTVATLHDFWFVCPTNILMYKRKEVCSGPEARKCAECWNYTISWFISKKIKIPISFVKNFFQIFNMPTHFERRAQILQDVLFSVDVIVTPSQFMRNFLFSLGIPSKKIFHIPNGYPHSIFRDFKKEKDPNTLVFGFIGAPSYQKGVHVLIKAMNLIKENNVNLEIYGGGGDYEYFQEMKKLVNNNSRIKLMGKFQDPKIPFSKIDVLIFPSLCYENSPLVLSEAALTRTPVIASNLGAIPEFVKDGVNGFLFMPGDERDLTDKMKLFVESPELIEKLGENWELPDDMDKHSKKIINIYRL